VKTKKQVARERAVKAKVLARRIRLRAAHKQKDAYERLKHTAFCKANQTPKLQKGLRIRPRTLRKLLKDQAEYNKRLAASGIKVDWADKSGTDYSVVQVPENAARGE
jgi:hypothetical protein